VFQVKLAYNGTTLTETITDETLASHPTFTHSYTVNIPSIIGSSLAYVGFTGGTGGLTTVADVQTWTYSFTEPAPGNSGTPAAPTSASSSAPATSSGSTSTSGTAQADPLAVAASTSSSTPGTNNVLMSLPPTPIVSNGSALPAGSSSSISSGWSAFQAGVVGPIVPASSAPSQLAGSIAQSPSSLDALDELFSDLGDEGSLDPLATALA
jgi:hypothetical protein